MTSDIAPRTVIETLVPIDDERELRAVYDAGNAVGIPDQPVRLTIRRMIAAGELEQRGRGRNGTIAYTAAGRIRIERDRAALALAARQDRGSEQWDGHWSLFAISAPERLRSIRDRLRLELLGAGAVRLSTGLYVSPHTLGGMLDVDDNQYLVTARATDLDIRGITDPAEIAELLWPAADIVGHYRVVEAALAADDASDATETRQIRLADALEKAMRTDPLVPPELRAAPWTPAKTRREWRHRWQVISER